MFPLQKEWRSCVVYRSMNAATCLCGVQMVARFNPFGFDAEVWLPFVSRIHSFSWEEVAALTLTGSECAPYDACIFSMKREHVVDDEYISHTLAAPDMKGSYGRLLQSCSGFPVALTGKDGMTALRLLMLGYQFYVLPPELYD